MKSNKSYWILTTEYPPLHGGGIGTYCHHTAIMFTKHDYNVTVFLADKSIEKIKVSVQENIRIVSFNPFSYKEASCLGYETLVSFAAAQTIKCFLEKEGQPECIDCQEYNGLPYFLLLHKHLGYAAVRDLKVLVTMHAPSFVYLPFNHVCTSRIPYFWIGEMEKFCIQAADIVIAPSNYIVEKVKEQFPECNREIFVVRNPFECSHPINSTPVNDREFVFYGKASPLKGILRLLELFTEIWKTDHAIVLNVIGDTAHFYHPSGTTMEELISSKYKVQISRGQLKLSGMVMPEELSKAISTAKAIIIPSLIDNLPYTVMECMGREKTLLVSDSGGHKEIIDDNNTGFIFSLKEPDSFFQAFKKVNQLTGSESFEIGVNASKSVTKQFSYKKIFAEKQAIISASNGIQTKQFPFLRPQKKLEAKADKIATEKGLLSVIIPYYNMGKFIDVAVETVLHSAYANKEIIIVDDGSTSTESLFLDKYRQAGNINVIHQQNKGLSSARNYGAAHARGEYLAFIDADDTIDPQFYIKAIGILEDHENVFFVGSWVKYFGKSEGLWPSFTPEPPFLLVHNMASSSLVIKREAFIACGWNDPEMLFGMEDYDCLINLVKNGYNGVIIPEPLLNYRVRAESMARQFNTEKVTFLYQQIAIKHKPFFNAYGAEISNLLNANGQGFLFDNPTIDSHLKFKGLWKLVPPALVQHLKQNRYIRKHLGKIYKLFKQQRA